MKGIVFNLLQDVVTREFGADTWDNLLDAAGLDGAYTSLGSYADEEIVKLVNVAATTLNKPPGDILRWFGRGAMPLLAERYPFFFDFYDNTQSFLLTLNNIIHPEVQKLYPGAATPVFDFELNNEQTMQIGYTSDRKLCALAEGFIGGAADHYGEQVVVEQTQCMHHGASKCVFKLDFSK